MDTSMFGIVIKVNDLDNCRIFYRDILDLGEPLIDSSFVVQFALAENLNLTLEKNQGNFLEHASAATSWCFDCGDIETLSAKLQDSGFPGLFETVVFGSARYYKGRDPENNVFLVRQKQ